MRSSAICTGTGNDPAIHGSGTLGAKRHLVRTYRISTYESYLRTCRGCAWFASHSAMRTETEPKTTAGLKFRGPHAWRRKRSAMVAPHSTTKEATMKWTAATLTVLLLPSAAFSFNIHPSPRPYKLPWRNRSEKCSMPCEAKW